MLLVGQDGDQGFRGAWVTDLAESLGRPFSTRFIVKRGDQRVHGARLVDRGESGDDV